MKPWNHLAAAIPLAAFALLAGSCNLGTPITITKNGTEVEGLSGILVTAEGSSAAGATVRVYATDGSSGSLAKIAQTVSSLPLDSVSASATGTFAFPNLPNGTYNLVATIQRGDTTLSIFLRGIVVTGKTILGTDTLRVAGSVTLRLRHGDSTVAGATCFVPGSPWQGATDADGNCTLTGLPPGTFQITVTHPAFQIMLSGDLDVLSGVLTQAGILDLIGTGIPLPAVPIPQSPAHLATSVSLTPTMKWTGGGLVQHYRVQIATDSAFVSMTVNDSLPISGTTTTADTVSHSVGLLAPGTTYYWRVASVNAAGSRTSMTRRFTTTVFQGSDLLLPPVLIAPSQNATGIPVSTTFVWNASVGSTNYRLQIATDSAFLSPAINDVFPAPVTAGPVGRSIEGLLASTAYYWRVRGLGTGAVGTWSAPHHFTTQSMVTPPLPASTTILIASQDAHIVAPSPSGVPVGAHGNSNFGKWEGFSVGVYDLNTVARGVIQFQMPQQFAGTQISRAVIRIHSYGWITKHVRGDSVRVNVHRLFRDWKEGNGASSNGQANSALIDGVTGLERFWGTQDGTEDWNHKLVGLDGVDAAPIATASATRPQKHIGSWEFEVTALAKAWAENPAQNFGVLFTGTLPAADTLTEDYPVFYTKDASVIDAYKPQLILTTEP